MEYKSNIWMLRISVFTCNIKIFSRNSIAVNPQRMAYETDHICTCMYIHYFYSGHLCKVYGLSVS